VTGSRPGAVHGILLPVSSNRDPSHTTRHAVLRCWPGDAEPASGAQQGTTTTAGVLRYGAGAGLRRYTDPHAAGRDGGPPDPETWEWAAWVSEPVTPGFPVTSVIASWNATTPSGTWIEVEVRATRDGVGVSRWYALGRWAETDLDVHATSVPGQADADGRVSIDVLEAAAGVAWTSYQLRVSLMRRPGSAASPEVRLVTAVAASFPGTPPAEVSAPHFARGLELPVPAYSQQLHRGEYPNWDGGGESWCSPTSTTMVLGHWGRGPSPEEYTWVQAGITDPFVDFAARSVFDHSYQGAGNWSFNTAYAARYGTRAFVTRLRSLTEAEQFICAGIPLVATVSFDRAQLDGAGYDTPGHLLTIVGFDEAGNVISNDPASHGIASNDEVRVVYDRAQFERIWQGGGGVVYVIHPPDVPLPPRPAEANW
jgi:hypothetical protein